MAIHPFSPKLAAMALKLFNTLTRKNDEFKPLEKGKVGMYCCGPTVYNYQHVGNMRCYLFEDLLRRTLEMDGYAVRHYANITDVGHLTSDEDEGEDKMEAGARREGKTVWEIADHYTQAFFADLKKLNIKSPDKWTKATDHIPEQQAMVDELFEKGYAYEAGDTIYYDTSKFKTYGDLARKDMEGQQAGARVACDDGKRNNWDFALWKYSPQGEQRLMEWDYRGRKGFPGWHLECSAMSRKYLGDQFDIHCGGIDHIPIHHTNEIAQTEAVTGKSPWVRYWMHSEFLLMGKDKMSKSSGDFLTLSKLIERGYSSLDFRYLCFNTHYRKGLKFSNEAMDNAKAGRERLMKLCEPLLTESEGALQADGKKHEENFTNALLDDLNAPRALAACWEMVQDSVLSAPQKRSLLELMDDVLALDLLAPRIIKEEAPLNAEQQAWIKEREQARHDKNWARSDELRDKLAGEGIIVKDSKDGTAWTRN